MMPAAGRHLVLHTVVLALALIGEVQSGPRVCPGGCGELGTCNLELGRCGGTPHGSVAKFLCRSAHTATCSQPCARSIYLHAMLVLIIISMLVSSSIVLLGRPSSQVRVRNPVDWAGL